MARSRYQLPVCVDPSSPQQQDYVQTRAFLAAVLQQDAAAEWVWCDDVGYEDCLVLSTVLSGAVVRNLCRQHGTPPMAHWMAPPEQFCRPDAGLYELQRVLLGLQAEGKVRCCTVHACSLETVGACQWIKPLTLEPLIRNKIREWARAHTVRRVK